MSTVPKMWYCIGVVRDEDPRPTRSLFSTTMELTNSFPPVDAFVKQVKEFDYVKFGDNAIQFSITAFAVVVVVLLHGLHSLLAFQHGILQFRLLSCL